MHAVHSRRSGMAGVTECMNNYECIGKHLAAAVDLPVPTNSCNVASDITKLILRARNWPIIGRRACYPLSVSAGVLQEQLSEVAQQWEMGAHGMRHTAARKTSRRRWRIERKYIINPVGSMESDHHLAKTFLAHI